MLNLSFARITLSQSQELTTTARNAFIKGVKCFSSANHRITSTDFAELSTFDPNHEFRNHEDLYQYSINFPEKFWGALARSRLQWMREFGQVMDCDLFSGRIGWFLNGQLNVSVNCVDRHMKKNPEKIALIWEKDEPGDTEMISYRKLYKQMNQVANLLLRAGVRRGDRVAIYMPNSPMAVAVMLACTRIGAVHSVVFAGFSAEALSSRINDAKAETLITVDQAVRGGKIIPMKKIVDEAVRLSPSIRRVFVSQRTGADVKMGKKDIFLEQVLNSESTECAPAKMDSEDPLFMLYTSGSTGKPKGILHTQAGYLLYAAVTHKHVFDFGEDDRFGCVADIGWITGHSYIVYGPLCNGGTTLLFESTPVYPNPGRYWETAERHKLTHFYGAPTAIRLLIKHGRQWVKQYDLSSLRVLGTVGEPINADAWEWYHSVVGRGNCTVVDTWWQTETGGICIAPRPSAIDAEIKPGMAMRPMFGMKPVLLDEQGKVITSNDAAGALCLQCPWPGMARTLFGDHERFVNTYYAQYPGYYFSGDGAYRDPDGFYQITGRMDDVINVSGHRLGTAEIEDVITRNPSIAEAAVVGIPHELKGEGLYAYVVLKNSSKQSKDEGEIIDELKSEIKRQIASYAIPEYIQICSNLPKTSSGKIMRRILRKVAVNNFEDLGDITTLADPTVIETLINNHLELTKLSQAQ